MWTINILYMIKVHSLSSLNTYLHMYCHAQGNLLSTPVYKVYKPRRGPLHFAVPLFEDLGYFDGLHFLVLPMCIKCMVFKWASISVL